MWLCWRYQKTTRNVRPIAVTFLNETNREDSAKAEAVAGFFLSFFDDRGLSGIRVPQSLVFTRRNKLTIVKYIIHIILCTWTLESEPLPLLVHCFARSVLCIKRWVAAVWNIWEFYIFLPKLNFFIKFSYIFAKICCHPTSQTPATSFLFIFSSSFALQLNSHSFRRLEFWDALICCSFQLSRPGPEMSQRASQWMFHCAIAWDCNKPGIYLLIRKL